MTKQSPEDREPRNSVLCHQRRSALVRLFLYSRRRFWWAFTSARVVRLKTPLDADGHIVFCEHEYHPACEVLLYCRLIGASRWVEPSCRGKSRGTEAAKLGALSIARVGFTMLNVVARLTIVWHYEP